MNRIFLAALLAFAVTSSGVARATIIESGDLNIIDDAGNPSDGLRFLDMTYSDGLSLADALANAQATYADARLATPDEWDDLFSAAGVTYSSSLTASDAFSTGAGITTIVNAGDPGAASLHTALGPTDADDTLIWSQPDGSSDAATTRDELFFTSVDDVTITQNAGTPPHTAFGWLLVSEVPEPSTISMLALGTLALGLRRRRAVVR